MQQSSAVESPHLSLFAAASSESPEAIAASLAPRAMPGHFDELRGAMSPLDAAGGAVAAEPTPGPTPVWASFFRNLGEGGFSDLDRRTANLHRQVRDNGVTYNVYADTTGTQRPWSLDLFPLIIAPEEWQRVEAGVLQRARLLERVLEDVYGPQRLLAANLLPPALVHGHPGYLRTLHGVAPPGGRRLMITAFDLARDPQGQWWVVSQRTQAPSGLGYLMENRLITSRLFPQAFGAMRVQRLAATYSALVESLRALSPGGGEAPRIVLLTPGPYNETYFEHAFLARYLGLTLAEGSDLTVRDERLFLKTLGGLEPVHGVLKRLDDEFLDPLELRPDSRLGVPGLLQAIRAGNVLMANMPGSAFLESPALLGFLPALSRQLLGQELQLPSLPTWWCGERAAMQAAHPLLHRSVIKPTYTTPGSGAVLGRSLTRRELQEWARKIERAPDEHTVQAWMPLSQMPTWKGQRIATRSLMLRVFALPDGPRGWRVLPGGLTRLAGASADIASMQRGGSSADSWVLTRGEIDRTTLLPQDGPTGAVLRQRAVTSRAGENLFWLGRYTERTENSARLARLALESLSGEDQSSRPLLEWLSQLAADNALVPAQAPPATRSRRVFERALLTALGDTSEAASVGFNLSALRGAASAVRERLSVEQWNLIVRAEHEFLGACKHGEGHTGCSPMEALRVLEQLSAHTAAMTGAQTDRMTRDNGWRLLSIGRHLERLTFLASALSLGFETGAVRDEAGFDAILALFDSGITFRGLYQKRHHIPALVDLLVLDRDNPRSLGWVLQTLRGRLARLEGKAHGDDEPLEPYLPDPEGWTLEQLSERGNDHQALRALLQQCVDAAHQLSDDLGTRYFTLTSDDRQSVGA